MIANVQINPNTVSHHIENGMNITEISRLRLGSRAVYQLCIDGEMIEEWRDYLNPSSFSSTVDAEGFRSTIMTCEVLDQAQLLGILETINGWKMSLVWLNCIAVPGGTGKAASGKVIAVIEPALAGSMTASFSSQALATSSIRLATASSARSRRFAP